MTLGTHTCNPSRGGIRAVRLYEACGIASVDYDPATRRFANLLLREGYEPHEVVFAEGGASYTEEATLGGGVRHQLRIRQRGVHPDVVASLEGLSAEGVVAVVECASGESLLVGYSARAAADYPLRMTYASVESGAKTVEIATTSFVLSSLDGWSAAAYEVTNA